MEATANREVKDRFFRFLFGRYKENALSLYNAINNSHYTNAADIEFNMIDDVIFLGMRNDVSFLFQTTLNVYEHQSSPFRNMPLRGLSYVVRGIEGYLAANKLTAKLYGSKLVKIPAPKFIVFYNGPVNIQDRLELKLSEAFQGSGGCLEMTVVVYNINEGHNPKIME